MYRIDYKDRRKKSIKEGEFSFMYYNITKIIMNSDRQKEIEVCTYEVKGTQSTSSKLPTILFT